MIKLIHTINIFFRTLGEFFSDFGKKNTQVCRNSNLSVQMKNVKKNSWIIGFSSFLDFNKKTRIFTRTFLAGLSKLLSTCPEEHFQSKISERKSWKLQDFRIIFEVFGSMAEKFFRVCKTVKDVQGNSLKKVFTKRKFRFFSDSELFSYFWRKTLSDLRNPQSEKVMK